MPTVLRIAGFRVVIYPNDHRPAHVHVVGAEYEAAFNLRCPDGPPELRESFGFSRQNVAASWPCLPITSASCVANGKESMAVSEKTFEQAKARMAATRTGPIAVAARYDRGRRRVVISLNNGFEVAFPPHAAEGLAKATSAQLAQIEVTPSGLGLHWPKLDADLYLPSLFAGILGSKRWIAAELGTVGGRARSPAKAAAARENGKRGGRPPKPVMGG